jgi:hypothetical protein
MKEKKKAFVYEKAQSFSSLRKYLPSQQSVRNFPSAARESWSAIRATNWKYSLVVIDNVARTRGTAYALYREKSLTSASDTCTVESHSVYLANYESDTQASELKNHI